MTTTITLQPTNTIGATKKTNIVKTTYNPLNQLIKHNGNEQKQDDE
jgi:hypothetical protein